MKDIIVGILVVFQKLINTKSFWGAIYLAMILYARPTVIDKFLSNPEVTKELVWAAVGGGALGFVINKGKEK